MSVSSTSASDTRYQLWNSNWSKLIPCSPFSRFDSESSDFKLSEKVMSDHAELSYKIFIGKELFHLKVFNMSNGKYHPYFKPSQSNPNPTFGSTHLCVDADKVKTDEWLKEKFGKQCDEIILDSHWVDIQIIVECSWSVIENLKPYLPNNRFILHQENTDEKFSKSEDNMTIIIIDTSKLKIIDSGFKTFTYKEIGNTWDSKLTVPFVQLETLEKESFLVYGVHISGCASQNPSNGNKILMDLLKDTNLDNVLASGDFNSPAENFQKNLPENYSLLKPLYPTHANPNCQISAYDHLVFKGKTMQLKQSSLDSVGPTSTAFVECLLDNINKTNSKN